MNLREWMREFVNVKGKSRLNGFDRPAGDH